MNIDPELKDQFDTLPEINVYFLITEIGTHVGGANAAHKQGRMSDKDFTKVSAGFPRLSIALEYGISQLHRLRRFYENSGDSYKYCMGGSVHRRGCFLYERLFPGYCYY